jgi:hypothetical protein
MTVYNASKRGDLQKLADKMSLNLDTVVRKSLLELTGDIIKRTPVDTGRARGNWQATVGSPATGVLDAADKSGDKTTGKAQDAISKATGNIYYLTNNLPYIQALEYGHSKEQAPHGFVRLAVADFEDYVKQNIRS